MARKDRRRSRQWHFGDSGSRFKNTERFKPKVDHSPISKTFTRKIMFCRRCRSRVVSNVSHCPYCGKNLLPLYQRFWFWLAVVLVIGAGFAALILFSPGLQITNKPGDSPRPIVVGEPEGTPYKNLQPNTTIAYNALSVTVINSYYYDVASNGVPIIAIEARFSNAGTTPINLYSTQWQLESEDGTRVDCFIGKNTNGANIISDFDTRALTPGSTYTATLYFAIASPSLAIFAPHALSSDEEKLVSWALTSLLASD